MVGRQILFLRYYWFYLKTSMCAFLISSQNLHVHNTIFRLSWYKILWKLLVGILLHSQSCLHWCRGCRGGLVLSTLIIRKKTSLYLSTVQCLTKTQGSRFQLLVQRAGIHSNSKIFLRKSNKVFGEGQASDFSLGLFNQDLPRSELGTSLYHGHN